MTHSVSGVFFYPFISEADVTRNIGVTLVPNPPETDRPSNVLTVLSPNPAHLEPAVRTMMEKLSHCTFFNTAVFTRVKILYTQKRGPRYTGLFARFEDDTPVVLGQWDPSDREGTSLIYSNEDGPLHTITFVLSDTTRGETRYDINIHRYLEDIIIGDHDTNKVHFKWNNLGKVCEKTNIFITS